MSYNKLIKISLLQSIIAAVYIIIVSFLLSNGEKFFGKNDNIFGGVAILLLFVVSAAIMAVTVLGRSILMYLEGHKKEAIKLFFLTLFWLICITIALFVGLAIYKN